MDNILKETMAELLSSSLSIHTTVPNFFFKPDLYGYVRKVVMLMSYVVSYESHISSVESQKGAIIIQRCFVENQKGATAIDIVQQFSTLLVVNRTSLNIDSALLGLN